MPNPTSSAVPTPPPPSVNQEVPAGEPVSFDPTSLKSAVSDLVASQISAAKKVQTPTPPPQGTPEPPQQQQQQKVTETPPPAKTPEPPQQQQQQQPAEQAKATPPVEPPKELLGTKEFNFAELRKSKEAAEAELKTYRERFGTLDSPKPVKEFEERLTAAETRAKELEERLAQIRFEESPRFKQQYLEPINTAYRNAVQAATEFAETDAEKQGVVKLIRHAVELQGKARVAALQQLGQTEAATLAPYLAEVDRAVMARDQALEQYKGRAKEFETEQAVAQEQQLRQIRTSLSNAALEKVRAEGHFIFAPVPGNEEWNQFVAKQVQQFQQLVHDATPQVQTEALALSVAAPIYQELYLTTKAQLAQVQSQLDALRGARPRNPGATPPASGGGPTAATPGALADFLSSKIPG